MGLYKGKVQNIFTGSYKLPRTDDNRTINVSRKKTHKQKGNSERDNSKE
jgi:hypothetical protein